MPEGEPDSGSTGLVSQYQRAGYWLGVLGVLLLPAGGVAWVNSALDVLAPGTDPHGWEFWLWVGLAVLSVLALGASVWCYALGRSIDASRTAFPVLSLVALIVAVSMWLFVLWAEFS